MAAKKQWQWRNRGSHQEWQDMEPEPPEVFYLQMEYRKVSRK